MEPVRATIDECESTVVAMPIKVAGTNLVLAHGSCVITLLDCKLALLPPNLGGDLVTGIVL
ncbi:hypothetical protein [Mycobacterium lepromatosis]|uniref:hypothetical protein n=1 Tax=Mycobacterium lepromatosis TaxID=480418 RepID=UPI000B266FDF